MRYHEISSGFNVPVSSEEQSIIDSIEKGQSEKSGYSEREQEVARLMVSRGLLTRTKNKDGATAFKVSSSKDIWSNR